MTCLLYGIVSSDSRQRDRDSAPPVLPPGVGGAVVRVIEAGGLGAAVSLIDPADLAPNVPRLLSFANVVEALHAQGTVLPMRYGCLLGDEGHVVDLLRDQSEEYAAILRGLDGCAEMGVRVLLPAETSASPCRARAESAAGPASGHEYLIARAARSTREETFAGALAAAKERVLGALGGLAERTDTDENGTVNPGVASLAFLVRREAVTSFRRAFRRIERTEPALLLLSGPWPPWSFAVPEQDGRRRG